MDFLRCQKENHQKYEISFYYKDQQQWKLACLQCQYESNLSKDQFIPIKNIEQMNLESQKLLSSENIQEQFQQSKTSSKQWIGKFTTIIEEIFQFILKLDDQMQERIETIKNFNLDSLSNQSFQTIISCRETVKDEILKKKNFLLATESNLKQAYNLLQNLIKEEAPKLNQLNKENLVYKDQENQIQQKQQQIKVVEPNPPQQQQKLPQQDLSLKDYFLSHFQTPVGLNCPTKNEKYRGEYKNGKYHGEGELIKDGYVYKGTFVNGLKHGKGQLKKENDDYSYEGEFVNDKKHGFGKEIQISYDIDKIQIAGSFFKTVTNPKQKCLVILEGWFENDKKNGTFKEQRISNSTSTSKYVIYANDEFQSAIYEDD